MPRLPHNVPKRHVTTMSFFITFLLVTRFWLDRREACPASCAQAGTRSRGGGSGGSVGRVGTLLATGRTGLCAISSDSTTVSTGRTTWNFTTTTATLLAPLSPQGEARSAQPDFACVPLEVQQHVPRSRLSREQQHWWGAHLPRVMAA